MSQLADEYANGTEAGSKHLRAVDAAAEGGGDARGAGSPENPNKGEENGVTAHADDCRASMGGMEESAEIDEGEQEGEPGGEGEETGAISDAGIQVVVMLVESGGQPGRNGSLDGRESGQEGEGNCGMRQRPQRPKLEPRTYRDGLYGRDLRERA